MNIAAQDFAPPTLVGIGRGRAEEAAPAAAPCAPMAWIRGRLLPLDSLPRWQRFVYRLLRLPPLVRVEPEGEVRVADFQALHYTRSRAVSLSRGTDGYVWGLAFEADEGDRTHKASTFSRPRHPAYRRQEERDAARYTGDLRECVEMTVAAENARLRRALEHYLGLGVRAETLSRRIDRLL